jgi:transposase-like protein
MPTVSTPEQKRQWEEKIRLQSESGQSLSKWCREHQVNYDSMIYWRKKLGVVQQRPLHRSSFKELPVSMEDAGVNIEYQHIQVHFPKNLDPLSLMKYLRALKEQP